MKSKKAEEYLNRIYKPGNKSMKEKVYDRDMAEKAVEIAEDEIIRKAMLAFCSLECCEICWLGGDQDNGCDMLSQFIEVLDK